MSDLIQALNICLKFTPGQPTPGLNGVFFDFSEAQCLRLYATDGHMMVEVVLRGMEVVKADTPYFLPTAEIKKVVDKFVGEQDVSITAWDNEVMFMAGPLIHTASRMTDEYEGRYKSFFKHAAAASGLSMDFERLHKAIGICSPVMSVYEGCGPVFTIRTQQSPADDKHSVAVITPKIVQEMSYMEAIKIVIMEVSA